MRPSSIISFERLYLASVVLGLLGGIWAWLHWTDMMPGGTPPQMAAMMPTIMAGGIVFSLIVDLLLWFFIARRGSEVAKWIYVVLFAVAVAGVLRSLLGGGHVELPGLVCIVALLRVLVEAACAWLLFRPGANAWFKGDRAPRDLNDTFS